MITIYRSRVVSLGSGSASLVGGARLSVHAANERWRSPQRARCLICMWLRLTPMQRADSRRSPQFFNASAVFVEPQCRRRLPGRRTCSRAEHCNFNPRSDVARPRTDAARRYISINSAIDFRRRTARRLAHNPGCSLSRRTHDGSHQNFLADVTRKSIHAKARYHSLTLFSFYSCSHTFSRLRP